MPSTYKILGQSNPGASDTDMITVGSGKQNLVSTLVVCNTTAGAATYRVYARVAGATTAVGNAIVYDATVPANDTVSLTLGVTLAATDKLTVRSSVSNVTFTAFGVEFS